MFNFQVTEINPSLYMLRDPLDVNVFLITGSEKALLFDTGYGIADIPSAVKEITDKPVTVVLGHGHIDHANGAYQFSEAYLREPDFELFYEHTSSEMRGRIAEGLKEREMQLDFDMLAWINAKPCKLIPLEIGKVFDLGGINVEVIDMAGHTGGSIGLLIKEQRILLDSDSANSHCWMFMPQSTSVREYAAMLRRVRDLDFDFFYVAHQTHAHPKSDFDKYISVTENASIEKSQLYETALLPDEKSYIYTEDDVAIVINERTINEGR